MYFFLHIPKSAGTAVKTTIGNQCSSIKPNSILDVSNREADCFDNIDRDEVKFIIGHFGIDFIQKYSKKGDKKITFLRKPEDRLMSMYRYWSSGQASTTSADRTVGMSFAEFLKCNDRIVAEQVENIQTWMLASDYRNDQRKRLERLKPFELLSLAKFNLMSFDFVGFQEHYDESMSGLGDLLGFEYEVTERINKTVLDEFELSAEHKEIDSNINLDSELYSFALKLAKKRGWLKDEI